MRLRSLWVTPNRWHRGGEAPAAWKLGSKLGRRGAQRSGLCVWVRASAQTFARQTPLQQRDLSHPPCISSAGPKIAASRPPLPSQRLPALARRHPVVTWGPSHARICLRPPQPARAAPVLPRAVKREARLIERDRQQLICAAILVHAAREKDARQELLRLAHGAR